MERIWRKQLLTLEAGLLWLVNRNGKYGSKVQVKGDHYFTYPVSKVAGIYKNN